MTVANDKLQLDTIWLHLFSFHLAELRLYIVMGCEKIRDSPFLLLLWLLCWVRARIAWTTHMKERHKFGCAQTIWHSSRPTPNDRPTDRVQVFQAMHLNLLFYAINHVRDSEYVCPFIRAFVFFFLFRTVSLAFLGYDGPKASQNYDQFSTHEWNVNKMRTMQTPDVNAECNINTKEQQRKKTKYLSLIDEWNGEKKETTELNLHSLTRHDLFIVVVFCLGISFAHFFFRSYVFVESKQQVFWLCFICWIFVLASHVCKNENGEIDTGHFFRCLPFCVQPSHHDVGLRSWDRSLCLRFCFKFNEFGIRKQHLSKLNELLTFVRWFAEIEYHCSKCE